MTVWIENIERIHASILEQRQNIDKLLTALRDLIDRIPPENLRRSQLRAKGLG